MNKFVDKYGHEIKLGDKVLVKVEKCKSYEIYVKSIYHGSSNNTYRIEHTLTPNNNHVKSSFFSSDELEVVMKPSLKIHSPKYASDIAKGRVVKNIVHVGDGGLEITFEGEDQIKIVWKVGSKDGWLESPKAFKTVIKKEVQEIALQDAIPF